MNWLRFHIDRLFRQYKSYTTRSRTVRYAFPIMLIAVSLLGAATVQHANQSRLTLETDKQVVRAGEMMAVHVYVTAATPINTIDIAIDIPRNLLQVTGIDTGESVITLWTVDPYVENNRVLLRGGTFRRGFVGKHLIATINTRAKANGIASIDVSDASLYAGDGSGAVVSYADTEATSIYIGDDVALRAETNTTNTTTFTGTAVVTIETDIDGDGQVTLQDVSRFLLAWRDQNIIYDFNGDGRMTFRDFGVILTQSFLR